MTTARIRAAFEAKVKTWAAAQSPALPVAWTNVEFTPPAGPYCRAFLIPARTASRDLGGMNRSYAGVFQISLYLPIGEGPARAEALAASLETAFPVEDPLIAGQLYVFLSSPMSAAAPVDDPGRYVVPISCTYRAEDYLS